MKEIRDKVQQNADLLKETFKDKYNIMQYEKSFVLLAKEKIAIQNSIRDTFKMKKDNNQKLLREYSEIEERTSKHKEKIQNLTSIIYDLENNICNINDDFQMKMESDQKKMNNF